MPRKPAHPCHKAGCTNLTLSRYCEAHTKTAPVVPAWRTTTGSSASRGYGTNWRKLRLMMLARDPICTVCCKAASTTVDHILAKAAGGDDSPENLRGLCNRCHSRKTAKDGHARKALKRLSVTIRPAGPRR